MTPVSPTIFSDRSWRASFVTRTVAFMSFAM
jgi:hypothetical protein